MNSLLLLIRISRENSLLILLNLKKFKVYLTYWQATTNKKDSKMKMIFYWRQLKIYGIKINNKNLKLCLFLINLHLKWNNHQLTSLGAVEIFKVNWNIFYWSKIHHNTIKRIKLNLLTIPKYKNHHKILNKIFPIPLNNLVWAKKALMLAGQS